MKKTKISGLKPGEEVSMQDMQAMCENVWETKDNICFLFSDDTGKIKAYMHKGQLSVDAKSIKGQVVTFSAIVLYEGDGVGKLKLLDLKVVPKEEIQFSVFSSISEEKLNLYETEIAKMISHLKGSPYEKLVLLCFSRPRLDRMRRLPATLSRHCVLQGGMLHAVATVTRMVVEMARYYRHLGNGIYGSNVEWDLMIAAAMLHNIGNFLYYSPEEPFTKTTLGINYGYQGCVTEELENVIRSNELELSLEDKAKLIGVIAQCNPYRVGTKALRLEAILLRDVFQVFTMLDTFDRAKAEAEKEDGEYVFDEKLRCYITLSERRDE